MMIFDFCSGIWIWQRLPVCRRKNSSIQVSLKSAPADAEEAITNYDMVLDSVGELSADFIAPRSEDVDHEGNTLNEDGSVSYAKGIAESLEALSKADVMGFTLPHRFGGLNFPCLIYSMAIEMVSRADASLMNIFGSAGHCRDDQFLCG